MSNNTQRDIAKELNLSQMTVSRALNNSLNIEANTKKLILKTAKKMGYVHNRIASGLISGKTHTIGLIVPSVSHSFFPEITRNIEEVSRQYGYHVILCHSEESHLRVREEINLLRELRVDGMIITPAANQKDAKTYRKLKKEDVPFVLIDRYLPELDCNYVVTDNLLGGIEVTEYLIKLGHSRITHIRGPENASSSQDIFEGYCNALEESNISLDKSLVIEGGFNIEDGYRAGKKILKLKKKPTAIFAVNDLAAIGICNALVERDIAVPKDMAVVGYSDIELASMFRVPLTTYKEPTKEVGRMAAQILMDEIETKTENEPRKVILKGKLIIRESARREEIWM